MFEIYNKFILKLKFKKNSIIKYLTLHLLISKKEMGNNLINH